MFCPRKLFQKKSCIVTLNGTVAIVVPSLLWSAFPWVELWEAKTTFATFVPLGARGGGSWSLYVHWGHTNVQVRYDSLLHIYIYMYIHKCLIDACIYVHICICRYTYVQQVGNGRNQSFSVRFAEDLQTRSNCIFRIVAKAATNSRRQLPTS